MDYLDSHQCVSKSGDKPAINAMIDITLDMDGSYLYGFRLRREGFFIIYYLLFIFFS